MIGVALHLGNSGNYIEI